MKLDVLAGPLVEHLSVRRPNVNSLLCATVLLDHDGLRHLELALVDILGLLEFEILALTHLLVGLNRFTEQATSETARIDHFISDVILVCVETLQAELGLVRRALTRLVVVGIAASHDGDHSTENETGLGQDTASAAVLRASRREYIKVGNLALLIWLIFTIRLIYCVGQTGLGRLQVVILLNSALLMQQFFLLRRFLGFGEAGDQVGLLHVLIEVNRGSVILPLPLHFSLVFEHGRAG